MKKYLLFLLVPILLAQTALAVTVYRHDGDVTTVRGDAVAGANITVYTANTTTKVTLYSERTSFLGTKTNPTYTDSHGRYFFYIPLGTYDIVISGYGITTYTMEDVNIGGVAATANGVFNVLDYGAIVDDGVDDSTYLQAAMDSCISSGSGTILFPPGDYIAETGLVLDRDTGLVTAKHITIEAHGATITAPDTLAGPILTIGASKKHVNHVILQGGAWGYDGLDSYDDSESACVKIINGSNIMTYELETLYGYHGIYVVADSTFGSAYNGFYNSNIRTCLNAISLECIDNDSWVNENWFMGGRISYAVGSYDCTSGYGISLQNSDTPTEIMTRNRFVDVSIECALPSYTITAATAADPCVVQVVAKPATHLFKVGFTAKISKVGGMVELDGTYAVEAITDTTITLTVDAGGFSAFTSGGIASYKPSMVYDDYGWWNEFIRLRTEGFDYPLLDLGAATRRARWVGAPTDFDSTSIGDIVATADRSYVMYFGDDELSVPGGQHSVATISTWNTAAANAPALAIKSYDGTDDKILLNSNGSMWFDPVGVPDVPAEGMLYYGSTPDKLGLYTAQGWEYVESYYPPTEAPADDTTPTVHAIKHLLLPANTGATVITQLDYAKVGQVAMVGISS